MYNSELRNSPVIAHDIEPQVDELRDAKPKLMNILAGGVALMSLAFVAPNQDGAISGTKIEAVQAESGVDGPATALQPAVRIPNTIFAPTSYTIPDGLRDEITKDVVWLPGCSGGLIRDNITDEVKGFVTAGHCAPGRNGRPLAVYTDSGQALTSPSIIDKCFWSGSRCTVLNPLDIIYGGLNGYSSADVEAELVDYYNSIDWNSIPANSPVVMGAYPRYQNPNHNLIVYELSYAGSTRWLRESDFVVTFGNWAVNSSSCSDQTSGSLARLIIPGGDVIPLGPVMTRAEYDPVVTIPKEDNPNYTKATGQAIYRDFQFYFGQRLDPVSVQYMCGVEDPIFSK